MSDKPSSRHYAEGVLDTSCQDWTWEQINMPFLHPENNKDPQGDILKLDTEEEWAFITNKGIPSKGILYNTIKP